MHFVGNSAWFAVLITIHIVGAIVGIGPAFTFGVIGAVNQKAGEGATLALLQVTRNIERFMLAPVVRFTQWGSGALMIFNRGLNNGFFAWRHAWLITAILLYITLFLMGEMINAPAVRKMIALAEQGAPKAEVDSVGATLMKIGPFYPIATLIIAVLMIWKPGSGCGVLLRC
ncbi:MAG: DUF2269 family protein [Actinomycetota bacterium]